jgi:hypothetical protein
MVKGNAGDQVDLADGTGTTGWSKGLAVSIDGQLYDPWNNNASLATVYVQAGVLVA